MGGLSAVKAGVNRSVRLLAAAAPTRVLVSRCTATSLRALAFHGVPDPTSFRELVSLIADRYHPVSGNEVADALSGQCKLPRFAVWFTFDDGLASTFAAGPMLAEHGIRATAFVCPSVVESEGLLWFQVVEEAHLRGLIDSDEEDRFTNARIKALAHDTFQAEIAELAARLDQTRPSVDRSPDVSVLHTWVDQGHEIGNHTWDHPLMDRCSAEEQQRQIVVAHDWLHAEGFQPRFFAYPNGNWSAISAKVAEGLGYAGSVLFDHRLTRLPTDTQRISRLRIDSDADPRRALSIASGAHSGFFHLARRAGVGMP